ncbi:hypothetical protein AAHC03_026257 [Spirometra sp. Aus1]
MVSHVRTQNLCLNRSESSPPPQWLRLVTWWSIAFPVCAGCARALRLLNIFENQASLHRVREVYCDEVTVTFQATPYILKKAVTSDLPNRQTRKHYTRDDMLMYLLVSSSLLKGSWPLPSWAWAVDCQTGEKNLDKKRRKELRSLQKFQSENEGRIKKSVRKRRFTSISEFQGTHSTQFFAANPWEIQQLYARIPRLIAIRDDSTTTIDIVESSVENTCPGNTVTHAQ